MIVTDPVRPAARCAAERRRRGRVGRLRQRAHPRADRAAAAAGAARARLDRRPALDIDDATAADLDAFVDTLRARGLFERGAALTVSRAPGRLDVMGGIADYSGSLVLQRPIAEATFAAVQRIDRPVLEIVSLGRPPLHDSARDAGARRRAGQLRRRRGGCSRRRRAARATHCRTGRRTSPASFLVLARERGLPLTSGARIVVVVAGARGQGRELLGRGRNGEHARGGGRVRHRARAARPRAAVPAERESRRRCAVRRDGSDDVRLRRTRRAAGAALSARRTAAVRCRSRTTSSSGESIPASVTRWAAPTTAPCGRARSWGCECCAEHAGVPRDYLANIAPAEFERELVRLSAGGDRRATTSSRATAARPTP